MRHGRSALLASAALALAWAGPVRAQDADFPPSDPRRDGTALGLRPTTAPRPGQRLTRPISPSLGPTESDPVAAAPPLPGRKAAPSKRSRPPTAKIVRPRVREPIVGLRLRPDAEVQTPVLGLPDPPPVAATAVGTPDLRRRRLTAEEDPYAPLGIKEGGVVYYPSVGQSVGYDTNPNRVQPGAKGSVALRTDGELKIRSDWLTHELTGELRGGYSVFPSLPGADRPDGDGVVRLRLDASRDTALDFEGRYRIDTQRPGSPDLSVATRERPIIATYGGSAGVTQSYNRFVIGLRANIDRETYEDARLSDGTVLRQNDRDVTQFGLRLRTGYELNPGMTPFVDTLIDTRVHDLAVDYNGLRRDSDGIGVKAGTTFELSRILTGEVSGGWQHRTYVDRRLRDLDGPLFDASLAWFATPLTTVRLRAGTAISETTVTTASGILTQTGTLEITHDLRRNLRLTLAATALTNDYKGSGIHEDGYGLSAKLDYRLTRFLTLRASYAFDHLKSSIPFGGYTANTYLLGVRFNP
jgi:hypothetical protein